MILQIHAGGWHRKNYEQGEILEGLTKILEILPADKVIIGWYIDPGQYRAIGEYLHARGIRMILWLPVFSETDLLTKVDLSCDLWGKPVPKSTIPDGEGFVFCCPSSERNLKNTTGIYDTYFSGCGFDGVFLDRVRTQSFLSGKSGVLSCGCKTCASFYRDRGVDPAEVTRKFDRIGDHFFDAESVEEGVPSFSDPTAKAFFEAKAELVASSVHRLCDHFHAMGLIVGLDLFAPLVSPFVGQCYERISERADFIKPMLYRRTDAPAGIGYEYDLLRKSVPQANGYPFLSIDTAFLQTQTDPFLSLPASLCPGIEINREAGCVRSDPEYLKRSVRFFRKNHLNDIVLSWDVLSAPEENIEAVREALDPSC